MSSNICNLSAIKLSEKAINERLRLIQGNLCYAISAAGGLSQVYTQDSASVTWSGTGTQLDPLIATAAGAGAGNLQAVTTAGNTTTNDIISGSRTNSLGRFSVEKTYTALNVHSFDDYSTLNPSSGGFGFGVYDASTTMIGSQTNDHFVGYQSRLTVGSGSTTNIDGAYGLTGLLVFNHHPGSGTVTNAHGVYIKAIDGGGSITNVYGLRIENVISGTNNFAIRAEGGKNSFVGEVMIGGQTTPIAKLDVRNSTWDPTLYCDNTKGSATAAIFNSSNGSGSNIGLDVTASGGTSNKGVNFGTAMSTGDWNIYSAGNSKTYIAGKVGLGVGNTSPSAALHLPAGTATANTAPLKLTSGVNLTTPENGAFEFDGTNLYFTVGGVRKTVTLI
jgi:hypothetical protein